jgi:hypothetical protein
MKRYFGLALLLLALLATQAPAEKNPQAKHPVVAEPTTGEEVNWSSVNSGGVIGSSSTNFILSGSVAQSVIGFSTSTNYHMGIGFWYGPGLYCVGLPGDANASNTYTLGDAIAIVNYIFNKPGCSPQPICWLSGLLCRGDWNASGTVTLGDVIQAVNYIFNVPPGASFWLAQPVGVCCQSL